MPDDVSSAFRTYLQNIADAIGVNSTSVDTGNVDDDGNPIVEVKPPSDNDVLHRILVTGISRSLKLGLDGVIDDHDKFVDSLALGGIKVSG